MLNVGCSLAAERFSLCAELPSAGSVAVVVHVRAIGVAFVADFGDSSDALAGGRFRFMFGSLLLGETSGFALFSARAHSSFCWAL